MNVEKIKKEVTLIPEYFTEIPLLQVDILQTHLEAQNSPVVFCHNDLQPLNLIRNAETGDSFIILDSDCIL